MDAKKKAQELVHRYRVLLMDDGEDYGEEILVSMLSKQSALVAVDETLNVLNNIYYNNGYYHDAKGLVSYCEQVKKEIEKL
jgi:hypothetical protein